MKRKSKKRFIWISVAVLVIIAIAVGVVNSKGKKNKDNGPKTVKVERKTIIDKALAVGSIEPLNEIAVKSKVSGVVGKVYVEAGDYVEKGTVVLEVNPDPTPLELVQGKRDVEMSAIEMETLRKELERKKHMNDRGLLSDQEYEILQKQYDESALRNQISKERLDLIEKGKVTIAETSIETVVKAPISGFILERLINVGDPVVPLTSYQPGTPLLRMADMQELLFKGTVDEIDVGKIAENMQCDLQVGALPGKKVTGFVHLISLKAQKEDNTTVFPIEIIIKETDGAVLRAGFSANASVIIAKKDSVLSLPERVVIFRNDSAFVQIPTGDQQSQEKYVETGLSDAITIEVVSGLEEGQEVLEKEVKEII